VLVGRRAFVGVSATIHATITLDLCKSLPVRQNRAEIFRKIFERIALVPASYLVTGY
jgi:hypothetical protein